MNTDMQTPLKPDSTPPEPPALANALTDLAQQTTLLALALGCQLKATGINQPEVANAIEANLRELMQSHNTDQWQPRARGLLELMYTALQERAAP